MFINVMYIILVGNTQEKHAYIRLISNLSYHALVYNIYNVYTVYNVYNVYTMYHPAHYTLVIELGSFCNILYVY